MRIRFAKLLALSVVLLNVVAFYFVWVLLKSQNELAGVSTGQYGQSTTVQKRVKAKRPPTMNDVVQKNITIVIRGFENFENDIPNTVRSITSTYPKINILIVTDSPPYPPLLFNTSNTLFQNVRHVYLQSSLNNSFESRTPVFQLKGDYVLFMPDSARIHTKKTLEKMFKTIDEGKNEIVAATFKATKPVGCLNTHINPKEWIIQFEESNDDKCDFVKGKHATLLRTDILKTLTDPFMLPFPDSFYVQAAAKGIKTRVIRDLPFGSGKELYSNPHNQWKAQQLEKDRTHNMFRSLGLKKVVRENGLVEWYGCRRDTPRCFGTVVDDTPQYLWEGKWTPPCCLAGLRRTARHVFQQLEQSQTRYWLEGGSLLGAIRSGDILPWDYDVDIGIYKEDISRCIWLLRAKTKPTADEQGFIWEKAMEGDFFRVHFSQINRLHVDIFPFYSRNGTMTKSTWFKTHRQDMEFPEHYLKPLSSIDFVGRTVSAPNNIHDFLELKFGEGAIENPVYPNPQKMAGLGYKISPEKT
ncbi:fukutin-related protein [Cimex lectularius]|uniref:Fukutin-related protein n=1 Tax=Cimex lectularius TaxID=79782 RepID=A0A8I6RD07_CIMLE|nr:fukutin-related protein [Cimex lectularius]